MSDSIFSKPKSLDPVCHGSEPDIASEVEVLGQMTPNALAPFEGWLTDPTDEEVEALIKARGGLFSLDESMDKEEDQ